MIGLSKGLPKRFTLPSQWILFTWFSTCVSPKKRWKQHWEQQNSLPSHLEVETRWSGIPGVMTPMSLIPVINLNLLQLLTAPVDKTDYKRNFLLFESTCLTQKCVCVPTPFKSRVVLSLVTNRQIPFHLIRCMCLHRHHYTQVSPRHRAETSAWTWINSHMTVFQCLFKSEYLHSMTRIRNPANTCYVQLT